MVRSVGLMTPTGDAVRLWLAITIAIIVVSIAGRIMDSPAGATTFSLTFYDVFCVSWLGLIWLSLRKSSPEQTRRWALAQVNTGSALRRILRTYYGTRLFGGKVGLFTISAVVFFGLFSALALLPGLGSLRAVTSVVGVVGAWGLLHTSFALRYAYLYYGDETSSGGLRFSGENEPDALDFAYYAFGVGTTFASPEVEVSSRAMRRTTLAHGALSFFYNTAILALVVNLLLAGP